MWFCVLIDHRFDDTNPGKEEGKYFVEIEKTIRWLGLAYITSGQLYLLMSICRL